MFQSRSARCAISAGAFYVIFILRVTFAATPHPEAHEMLQAARWWVEASRIIYQAKLDRGIPISEEDSAQTGLIGEEYSPITTTLGSLRSKLISANPDFAALIVRWLWTVGVKNGDKIAVSMSGSFPALNLAVYAAIETMHLHAVIISSLGASSWGANQPNMTWADIERLLKEKGMITHGSAAMSMGGTGDWGGGLTKEGKEILAQKLEASGVQFLEPEFLDQAVAKRLLLYGNLSQYICYINVGGGQAVLGRGPGGRALPTGLIKRLPKSDPHYSGEVDGVIFYFLRHKIPVIHMLEIPSIARHWGISTYPGHHHRPGKSPVYYLEE
jgi:poly-gamma-glutamate system protein